MNKLLEIGVLSVGGLCLFAVSFVGFALSAGVPMRDVAVIGPLFDDGEAPPTEQPMQLPEAVSEQAPASDEEVVASHVGLLSTWSFESSLDATELEALIDRIKAKEADLDRREFQVAEQEGYISDRMEALSEQHGALEEIRTELEGMDSALRLREQEVRRDETAKEEREQAYWIETAKLFSEGDASALSARLMKFEPDEAASVLRALPPDRATELLDALPDKDWKTYADAYTRAAQ